VNRFEFGFVPEVAVVRRWQFIHPSTTISRAERTAAWLEELFSHTVAARFTTLLHGPYWIGAGRTRWGDGETICIDVFFDLDRPIDVTVTIDIRAPHLAFLSELCLLANGLQWLAVMPDGRIFRPCLRRFLGEIQHGRATRADRASPAQFTPQQMTRYQGEPVHD
jgi:hypothetical protein